jgi:hypothetical protein
MTTQHNNFKNISSGSRNDALPMYIHLKIPKSRETVPLRIVFAWELSILSTVIFSPNFFFLSCGLSFHGKLLFCRCKERLLCRGPGTCQKPMAVS